MQSPTTPSSRPRPTNRLRRTLTHSAGWLALCVVGCSAEYAPVDLEADDTFGSTEAAVAACEGDDLQYDFNAFAASLAVAIANERGRWDVVSDFEVNNGKLELSSTGRLHCGSGCENIQALLRLQDSESSIVPFHSPDIYRSKLTNWYSQQERQLETLVDGMLRVDKGVYRIVSRSSGRRITMPSTWSGAGAEQSDRYSGRAEEQWRVVLDGTMHQLINVRSGKCLDLEQNTGGYQRLVQRSCSDSFSQTFDFSGLADGYVGIRTGHQQALRVEGGSPWNGARIVQEPFNADYWSQQFAFEPVGNGGHVALDKMATAVYSITVKHSGKAMGVAGGSLNDGASVTVTNDAPDDDGLHWYLTPMSGERRYQLMNRRSGKCLDLANPGSPTSQLVQRTCTTSESQIYYFVGTGEGHQALYTTHGVAIGVQGASTASNVPMVQGDKTWAPHQLLHFEPLMAGEPHELTFSHATHDGPCGDYYWYNISQPNRLPLGAPADSYVQLIFAGGKTSLGGQDSNPFIAQQVTGNLVAIDPSGYMNGGDTSRSGSCVASDILYDASGRARGACCIKYNGQYGTFTQSFWSATTFMCL